MKSPLRGQMSDSFLLGSLLAVTGGYLDAYSYLIRGHVFANAQTGNIVLLGMNLAEGRLSQAFSYLIPIIAFGLGVLAAELIRHFAHPSTPTPCVDSTLRPRFHWRQIVIVVEILVLLLVAFLPHGRWDTLVNTLISFLCAMQVQSFRKFHGNAYATTMCTGNLRSATELLWRFLSLRDKNALRKSLLYFAIILFFIGGAALGSLLTSLFAEKAVLLCCGLLSGVAVLMLFREEPLPIEERLSR